MGLRAVVVRSHQGKYSNACRLGLQERPCAPIYQPTSAAARYNT
jgi:hypothetical protein